MQSKLLTSLHEGLAAIRMADFLKKNLEFRGEKVDEMGCILVLKTGNQCTVSGTGQIFDKFKKNEEMNKYCGYADDTVNFYDENFESAPYQLMKFDQTFFKMPYDCQKSRSIVIIFDR